MSSIFFASDNKVLLILTAVSCIGLCLFNGVHFRIFYSLPFLFVTQSKLILYNSCCCVIKMHLYVLVDFSNSKILAL